MDVFARQEYLLCNDRLKALENDRKIIEIWINTNLKDSEMGSLLFKGNLQL